MRAVLGIALVVEGGTYFLEPSATPIAWIVGVPVLVSGGLIAVGLFTPFVAIVAAVDLVGLAVSAIPRPTPNFFDSQSALIFGLAIAVAIIGVGPGRFSIDAHVFGRREIIIPLPHSSMEQ